MKYNIMGLELCLPFNKLIKRSSVGKASLSDLNILHEAEICDLEREGSYYIRGGCRGSSIPDEGPCPTPSPSVFWSH